MKRIPMWSGDYTVIITFWSPNNQNFNLSLATIRLHKSAIFTYGVKLIWLWNISKLKANNNLSIISSISTFALAKLTAKISLVPCYQEILTLNYLEKKESYHPPVLKIHKANL